MILSGYEILKKQEEGSISIEPFNKKQLNPNSYNLKLHNELLVYKNPVLDMKAKNEVETIIIPEEGLYLKPGELYLGRTLEYTITKDTVPLLVGRSSIGRLGVFIHVTAGFGDVGFDGYWTLEILATKPIKIYPGVEICQIYYHQIKGFYDTYESDKYQKNTNVQPSMLYKDFENK